MSQNPYVYRESRDACTAALEATPLLEPAPIKPEDEEVLSAADPYANIARGLFINFQELARERTGTELYWKGAHHGFEVVTAGVKRCTEAYLAHTALTQVTANTSEHLQALQHQRTIRPFKLLASMREEKNKIMEERLGLRRAKENPNFREFIFVQGESSYFTPQPTLWQTAKHEAIQSSTYGEKQARLFDPAPTRCPSRRYLPMIWRSTVEACYQAGLFDFEAQQ